MAEKDPCYQCTKRWVKDGHTCHSTCKEYLERCEEQRAKNAKRRAVRDTEQVANDFKFAGIRKSMRHKRGHEKT